MDQLWIAGGTPLSGTVNISGAKNATLPILAACVLASESIKLNNMPHLKDVTAMLQLLSEFGLQYTLDQKAVISIHPTITANRLGPYELTSQTRASILLLGPLLTRLGNVKLGLPGGCMIGSRPINLHLDGLRAMGAEINIHNNYIEARCKQGLKGTRIKLELISVTTTQNLMMAATLAKGETIIHNAACEPEVEDLACFLNSLGARVTGAGTSTITIEGVVQLGGNITHTILPDRLEAATLLIAAACTHGKITLKNISPTLLMNVLQKLELAGASICCEAQQVSLTGLSNPIQPVDIQTAPYPGFPTDVQAQIMILNTIANGISKITETIFENRFLHVPELCRMGAKIKIIGRTAICTGVPFLKGAEVKAYDLRGGSSLILAALMAKGESIIHNAGYTDRGYEYLEEKFLKLGAKMQWVN